MGRKVSLSLAFLLTLFFSFSFPILPINLFADESITITTYYPSPYGTYNELTLYPHSTPVATCNNSAKGTMYYDLDDDQIYICNGTTWSTQAGAFVGEIKIYAGSTIPSGWLLCDGSAVSRVTYAALFSVIGTTYGVGNGSTTFNLPDLKGRAAIGSGQGAGLTNRSLGQKIGEESHTLTIAEMPSHNHTINDPTHTHCSPNGQSIVTQNNGGWGAQAGDFHLSPNNSTCLASSSTGITIQNTGGGGSHNVMQPSQVVNYIIKY